jgi:hypothetical protein
MYCPQCATENLDGASFCRGCGSNISLVPQALTGNLPAISSDELDDDDDDYSFGRRRRRRGRKRTPSIEKGIKNIFMGVGFILVALAIAIFGHGGGWWFWMLIPAFTMLGGGVAEIVRFKTEKSRALPAAPQSASMPLMTPRPSALPQRNTAELMPQPPSVTEGTTRHLGGEMPTKHLETPVEKRPKNV